MIFSDQWGKQKDNWFIWIITSALYETLPQFVVVLLISLFEFFLFNFVVEVLAPDFFPFDEYGLSVVIVFIGFLLPLSINSVQTRYNSYTMALVGLTSATRAFVDIARWLPSGYKKD